jgi:PAS domain S-box-containing protein
MKNTRKLKNTVKKKAGKKIKTKLKNPLNDKIKDVQELVHLLQVHQVELEHQNEELRIAHEELEMSRNKYVNLFDFSPIPYFTLDPEGIIKEVNLSASKMFGIDRKKLIGKNFITFIPLEEKDVFRRFIKTVFGSSVKHSCELKVINKDKRIFHVLLEGLKLDDIPELEINCQIALIDLTEYKRIEESLKKSNEKLKILNANKDKFFSIIAHDLRDPFQSLLGFSKTLATEIETLSQEEILLYSKALNQDLSNLYSLLDNLLHWSMMQRNILEFDPRDIDLHDVVSKTIEILNLNALKKNISVSNKINTGTFAYADINMLRLIVQNLLTNAIKFTSTDGQVLVSADDRKNFIEVTVQDSGIGIEPAKTASLFSFDTMYTTNGTDGEQGTGLGLPLCKEFVERNGGKIWVESELRKGSKFIFTLLKSGS